jgi:uncharacterized protein (TIGR01244 family)
MKYFRFSWLALLALATTALAGVDEELIKTLPNVREPQTNRIVSGAIGATDIGRIRAAGVKHVINLRTPQEMQDLNEGEIAKGLGLDYQSIPIAGAQSLTKENAGKLDEALKQAGDDPTVVHCASGNRVGALIALREAWINGKSTEAAIAEGKRWGLTSLEAAVRTKLDETPKAEKK